MVTREDQPIIDCDIHQASKSPTELSPYLPKVYQERIELYGLGLFQRPGYPNGGHRGMRVDSYPEDGSRPCSDVEMLQEGHLNVYNIEYGLLLGQEYRPISSLPDADYATALARAYNDWMIEHWIEKDDRLVGGAIIATQSPREAADELRRAGQHPGIVAANVPTGTTIPYGKRYYDPIYEACVEMDLPFVLHAGSEREGSAGRASYYVELRQERALVMQQNLASMVFEGLFERFPDLRVVCVENGFTWLPTFLWRMDADWKALGRETPWVERPPSDYVFEHCKFTTQPMESPEPQRRLLTIFEWAKAEKTLMFASDYPHFDFDSPELSLPAMNEEMSRRVFSENAREVFGLPQRLTTEAVPAG